MKITASDKTALVRLAAALPKRSPTRLAILAELKKALDKQPDPKKKYDFYATDERGNETELLKAEANLSEVVRAIKVLDAALGEIGYPPSGGLYWTDREMRDSPKLGELQERLNRGAFGIPLDPNGETFLSIRDSNDKTHSWNWNGEEWEHE